MLQRVITKIGDVFSVNLDNGNKRYFQYIANDQTQLNSDVIRVFKKEYSGNVSPNLDEVVQDDIDFHAHTMINVGVKLDLFNQEGKSKSPIEGINDIIFRGTLDYIPKPGGERVEISDNWRIWKINDRDFTNVGKLEGKNRKAEIGIVIPPFAIVEWIKSGKYNFFYPGFE